jgi:hypothetical protein
MIFAEEMKMNLYYGGFQQHNNPSNFASNPMEMNTAIWEPPGYSDTSSSNASLGYNNVIILTQLLGVIYILHIFV